MILPSLVMAVSLEPGAFDFRTRIKGGGRKRPPPAHKAPQCGAFSRFGKGAPERSFTAVQVHLDEKR